MNIHSSRWRRRQRAARERASARRRGRASARGGPHGDKREAIMAAALELFVERGFYGTAVPEIAERAGVGAGTIYRYFESKEALVNALYRERRCGSRTRRRSTTSRRGDRRASCSARCGCAWPSSPSSIRSRSSSSSSTITRAISTTRAGRSSSGCSSCSPASSSPRRRAASSRPAPELLMGIVMGGFIGVIRSCVEIDQPLESADWKLAEQCIWEAIRSLTRSPSLRPRRNLGFVLASLGMNVHSYQPPGA